MISLASTLLFGLTPALRTTSPDLIQGFVLGAAGVAVGLVFGILACNLVAAGTVWIATFSSTNPLLYAVIALPLLAITLLATYAPAR